MLKFILFRPHLRIRYMSLNSKLTKGSLTSRFHKYINQNPSTDHQSNFVVELSKKISNVQQNNHQFSKIIDKECMVEISKATNYSDILNFLDFCVQYFPHQILNMKSFDQALKISLLTNKVCEENFINLCFYISFFKKQYPGPAYLQSLLNKFLNEKLLNGLARMDIALICISAYKTSVRITNDKFHERVIREILDTPNNDHFILIAFIKSLKHNKVFSNEVLDKLNRIVKEEELDYKTLIHILPYIVETNIENSNLINLISEKCIRSFDENVRVKDVQKLLYSCALLNLKMNIKELEILEKMIINRVKHEEFNSHFDHFVIAALSLWILNYHSYKLISVLFEDKRFYKTGPHSRIKLDSRMKLLETCVEIERPNWVNKKIKSSSTSSSPPSFIYNRPSPGYLIKSSLEKVMNTKLNAKNAIYVQQIKNLNIAGILLTENDGKCIHYEVIDGSTSLADGKTANGIFQLKLRLLAKMNCDVQVININS